MLTDKQLYYASREDLKILRSRIFEELARRDKGGEPEVIGSLVVESRPHADGLLLLEKRAYRRKDGSVTLRGPYWTFRYHEDGKRRSIYLGKVPDPERALREKRDCRG